MYTLQVECFELKRGSSARWKKRSTTFLPSRREQRESLCSLDKRWPYGNYEMYPHIIRMQIPHPSRAKRPEGFWALRKAEKRTPRIRCNAVHIGARLCAISPVWIPTSRDKWTLVIIYIATHRAALLYVNRNPLTCATNSRGVEIDTERASRKERT